MKTTTLSGFRSTALRYLARGVPAALARQDPATGRFLAANGGFAQTNQDIQLALAAVYTLPHKDNPHHGDAALLRAISRAGDALRANQDASGRVEFIKVDGSRWGWTYMPWSLYHWLETYALMRGHLEPDCRTRWEEGLTLAFGGIRDELARDQLRLHNIPAWQVMGMARAGALFNRPEWVEAGAEFLRRYVEHQHPDGYWPEGEGPTTSYNRVYVHALGLQYAFSHDPALLPPLERALDFHLHFTYPDGANVETIDGRVRYHAEVSAQGWPGFVHFPKGRRLVRLMMDNLLRQKPEGGVEPHVASGLLTWPEDAEAAIPQTERDFAGDFHGRALIRRKGPWFICLNGYLMPDTAFGDSFRARWHMDRQNNLSIWHEKAGLIVGGGHSKHHPDFSTFSMVQGRTRWTQPESVRLEQGADRDTAVYTYGQVRGTVSVRVLTDAKVEITLKAEGGPCSNLVGLFTLLPKAGRPILSPQHEREETLDPQGVWGAGWTEADTSVERWVRTPAWRLHLPPGAYFRWPVYPFNPYAIDGTAPAHEAAAFAGAAMKPGTERVFVLEAL